MVNVFCALIAGLVIGTNLGKEVYGPSEILDKCQAELPRNEVCVLIAMPPIKSIKE